MGRLNTVATKVFIVYRIGVDSFANLGVFTKEEEAKKQVKLLNQRHGMPEEPEWPNTHFSYEGKYLDIELKHYWEEYDVTLED